MFFFFQIDDVKYPELYRKSNENNIKGCNEKTPAPFDVGYIKEIFVDGSKNQDVIKLVVNKYYRPENTHLVRTKANLYHDLNLLYWSDEEEIIFFSDVEGKCHVRYLEDLTPSSWALEGPNRFYFREAYDVKTETFMEPKSYLSTMKKPDKVC